MAESTGTRPRRKAPPIDPTKRLAVFNASWDQLKTQGFFGQLLPPDDIGPELARELDPFMAERGMTTKEIGAQTYIAPAIVAKARRGDRVSYQASVSLLAVVARFDREYPRRAKWLALLKVARQTALKWDSIVDEKVSLWDELRGWAGETITAEVQEAAIRLLASKWFYIKPNPFLSRDLYERLADSEVRHHVWSVRFFYSLKHGGRPGPIDAEFQAKYEAAMKAFELPLEPSSASPEGTQTAEVVGRAVSGTRTRPKSASPRKPKVTLSAVDGALAALPAHVLPHSRVALTLVPR